MHMEFLPTDAEYQRWRKTRLALANRNDATRIHVIGAIGSRASQTEIQALACHAANHGFARYRLNGEPTNARQWVLSLAEKLGLRRLDRHLCTDPSGISAIEVRQTDTKAEYIPYSNKPLSWHSDGYYNKPEQRLGAWLLHCERPAKSGGNNSALDPELLYIGLRDIDAEAAAALWHPETFSIPANTEEDGNERPRSTGPVFWVEKSSGRLHCRYSARKRHVQWREDPATQRAQDLITAQLNGDNPYIEHFRLQAGEGVVSRNALHNRGAFEDHNNPEQGRRIFRGRFYDTLNC